MANMPGFAQGQAQGGVLHGQGDNGKFEKFHHHYHHHTKFLEILEEARCLGHWTWAPGLPLEGCVLTSLPVTCVAPAGLWVCRVWIILAQCPQES